LDLLSRHLKHQVETCLGGLVDRVLGGCQESAGGPAGSARGPLLETIRQFVLAGGKRVRPQLCLWTYQHARAGGTGPVSAAARRRFDVAGSAAGTGAGRDVVPPPALDVACAWELFHAFLLCHDDIIDGADRRRGRPTLHHRLASLDGGSMVFGANLGIVAGDLLFAGSVRLLHELDLAAADPPLTAGDYQQLLRLFSRVGCETGFGQAIDIIQSHVPIGDVDERTVLRGYHWKTAAYTFEGPMLSGALLAGLPAAARAAVSRFALAVGQAYQLHNDLLDLRTAAHDGCDLVQGKRTPTLLGHRAAMSECRRRELDARMAVIATTGGAGGDRRSAVALAETLRQELVRDGAAERTQAAVERLLADARAATDDPALEPAFAGAMAGLLEGLSTTYFAPVVS
jgi:geranylgeranyl diphosphate synthase type I